MPDSERPADEAKRTRFGNLGRIIGSTLRPLTDEEFQPPHVPDTPITRRSFPRDSANLLIKAGVSFLDAQWNLIQEVVNGLADRLLSRRKLFIGSIVATAAIGGVVKLIADSPELSQDFRLAPKLAGVWSELQELSHPLTNDELLTMLHNPFKPISLTASQAAHAQVVGNADSEYLKDGTRQNHFGYQQPDSWLAFAADKVNTGLSLLGIDGGFKSANYAQPGASSEGLIGRQQYAGNVQLGAMTVEDMADDLPGEPTPRQMMEEHEGTLIAAVGLHGDDMRDTADLVLGYITEGGASYDADFTAFVRNPSRKLLTDHVADVLVTVLNSYKRDKERIRINFAKALDIYAEINAKRKREGKGDMYLVVTQPLRLDEAESAPYVPLGSPRGTKGKINMKDYGQGGKVAGTLITVPFYQIEKPLLYEFEQTTGVQVSSLPFLQLSGNPALCADDGHFNRDGQEAVANLFTQLLAITHDEGVTIGFSSYGNALLVT